MSLIPLPPSREIIPLTSESVTTDRLVLRAPKHGDIGHYRHSLRVNQTHLRDWSPTPPPGTDPTSLTAVSRSVIANLREWKRGEAFSWLIFDKSDNERVIGRVRVGGVMRGVFQSAYLGYWIDSTMQGRGLMTEAVSAVTKYAFEKIGLHRLQAAIMANNPASQRVILKAKYRREGVAERYLQIAGKWEDHILYAITAEEI